MKLSQFLTSSERPEGTLNYHEVQGLLFTIICSPELIVPSEWLPLVFNEQDARYANQDEAQEVVQALMGLYNRINTQIIEVKINLPEDVALHDSAMDNVGELAALGQWSNGFIRGHNWLIELWDHYTPDELQDELASVLMVLSFFNSRELANAFYDEISASSDTTLEEFAGTMFDMCDNAMNSYAYLSHSIQTALAEQGQPQQPFVHDEKVGRNDPCPCGSGKKYKKCCLH